MAGPDSLSDEEFLKAFEACAFSRACWTHRAHVRLAWLNLTRHPYEEAAAKTAAGIKKFNALAGALVGYHDTITLAFLRLIHDRIAAGPLDRTSEAFLRRQGDLLDYKNSPLLRHYRRETIDSALAKKAFVAPDVAPLPELSRVRLARPEDAPRLAEIYAPHVRTPVSFETEAPGPDEFAARLAKAHLWLVYERAGRVLGYAYGSKHRDRAAYQWSCETSVYVDPKAKRQGLGRALMVSLLEGLTLLGYRNAYAGVTLPNPASVGLHEALGFVPVGVYAGVGYKRGGWRDVGWWQKTLAPRSARPASPRSLGDARGSAEFSRALLAGLCSGSGPRPSASARASRRGRRTPTARRPARPS